MGLADELTGLAEQVGQPDVSALAAVSDFVGQTRYRLDDMASRR